jgi:Arc/MetJ-type ribon-helix-helix transcriptional regulator
MTIVLTPEVEKHVQERVARDEYDSPEAIVEAPIMRLLEEEAEEDAHLAAIRARVKAAEAEIDRGECVECDGDGIHLLTKDVHERGLKRLAAQHVEHIRSF